MLKYIKQYNLNVYSYQVDTENECFYNTETKETFEVQQDEITGEYKISGIEFNFSQEDKSSEVESSKDETNDYDENNIYSQDEPTEEKNNGKVKKLTMPNNIDNAAFVKSTFIMITIAILSVLIATIILTK